MDRIRTGRQPPAPSVPDGGDGGTPQGPLGSYGGTTESDSARPATGLVPELGDALRRLRHEVHVAMYEELSRRVAADPAPTREELDMGVYVEALEPQVRDAVREMRRKGYATHSSGFYAYDHAAQVVEGGFELPAGVPERLRGLGVEAERRGRTTLLRFRPSTADLGDMKERWDRVAGVLPDLGRPAPPARGFGSDEFRRLHREGTLGTGFIPHWLDDMGTYAGMPDPRTARRPG